MMFECVMKVLQMFLKISKYVKPPNKGIVGCVQKVICNTLGVLQTQHKCLGNIKLQINLGAFNGCCM
jgi:hypothetical protein